MKPVCFFDLETTGTNTTTDRIVQIAAIKCELGVDGGERKCVLVNPGIPIPKEASDVHGITDEMVKDAPKFSQFAKHLHAYFDGCDLGGFNIKRFDVPLLAEEFERCGLSWPAPGVKCFDAYHVFASKEERTLTNALQFYCGRKHDQAHDALADVLATIDVMTGQMDRYDDLKTAEGYAAFCNDPNAVDLAGKLVRDEQGEVVYAFGKDKGKRVKDQPGFAMWMLKQDFSTETKRILKRLLGWK